MASIRTRSITQWKRQALEDLPALFCSKQARKGKVHEEERDELLKQIGQLKVGVDWLKKSRGFFTPGEEGGSST
jgi:transposase